MIRPIHPQIFSSALATLIASWGSIVLAQDVGPPEGYAADEGGERAAINTSDAVSAESEVPEDVVVVTASRQRRLLKDSLIATQVITQKDIVSSGATNLSELMDGFSGFVVTQSSIGDSLQMHGLPADYVLILVDGMKVPGRVSGAIDLRRFPIENIERVEIVPGSASALYGSDAIAGVVNIITKRPIEEHEGSVSGGFGAFNSVDASVTGGVTRANWSARMTAGHHTTDGYDLDLSDIATDRSASQQNNLSTMLSGSPSSSVEVVSTGEYLYRKRQAVDLGRGGAGVFDRTNLTETGSVKVAPEWQMDDMSQLNSWASLSVFRDQSRSDLRGDISPLESLNITRENIVQVGSQFNRRWGSHSSSFGLETSYERLKTQRLPGGRGSRSRAAFYLQDEWEVVSSTNTSAMRLAVSPGFRFDADSQFGGYPTPRVAMRFDPNSVFTLRASYGWGFKAPDFQELYLDFGNGSQGYRVIGNDELRPEQSTDYTFGLEVRPHPKVSFTAQAYHNELTDRISTRQVLEDDANSDELPAGASVVDLYRYENVTSATTQGLEGSMRFLPLRGLQVDVSYGLLSTKDNETGLSLPGRSRHRASFGPRYRWRQLGLDVSGRASYVGARPRESNEGRIFAKPYTDLTLRASQELAFGIRASITGRNLLDIRRDDLLLPPRHFAGGLSANF